MKKITFTCVDKSMDGIAIPPAPASKFIPKWYKDMEQFIGGKLKVGLGVNNSTIKMCLPVLDSMTAGYIFTLENDLFVSWNEDIPQFNWTTSNETITFHHMDQIRGMPIPEDYSAQPVKFECVFKTTVPDGYSVLVTQPLNRFDLPFQIMSGIVEADSYINAIKFPFFIRKSFSGILEAGTPIAQIIPFKRENWQHEIKPYSESYIKDNHNFYRTAVRAYKNKHWKKKIYQ